MRAKLILIAFLIALPAAAHAEIHDCDGTWTNKPCKDAPLKKLSEQHAVPRSPQEVDREQRESWLTDLSLRRTDISRKYGVDIDISDVQAACRRPSQSPEACHALIDKKYALMDRRVDEALKIRHEQEKEGHGNEPGHDHNVIVVQQNFDDRRFHRPTVFPSAIGLPTLRPFPSGADEPFRKHLHPSPPPPPGPLPPATGPEPRKGR
jgi:hypothetical protein